MEQPQTSFEWGVYADATFAGLSVLIPIPLLDLLFERWFRQRMPRSIADERGRRLPPEVLDILNRGEGCSTASCLTLPIWLLFQLLKRLSRKILYFFTIKEAGDTLSHYWHRAFLINYMLDLGHLADAAEAHRAQAALEQTLDEIETSPLNQLAREVIRQTGRTLRTLLRVARRGEENEVIARDRAIMRSAWSDFGGYLRGVAAQYWDNYQEIRAQPEAPPAAAQ
ncbi:MAG: hypothetical protein R3272_04780 [Candidatus Promineifilaceae bacterium]|nr:hypothetical protein [Candidatus Promineifilaceae bacterium]